MNELNHIVNFVRSFKGGELEVKNGLKQWVWHSEPNSCPVCQERDGRVYDEKPEPVHPNCNCEFEDIDEEKARKYEEDYNKRLTNRDNVLAKLYEGTRTYGDRETPKDPNKSGGYCSRKVTDALQTAFGGKYERPSEAKDSGKSLEKVGFQEIPEGKNYETRKGDVKVYQPHGVPNVRTGEIDDSGHVQMFDGEQWVSDYNQATLAAIDRGDQTGMYPNQNYKDHEDSKMYRYPKWQEWR